MCECDAIMLLSVVSLMSCVKLITRDGFEIAEWQWTDAESKVLARAAFDMNCPKENLTLTITDADRTSFGPKQMGVQGCEQSLVYVRISPSDWVLNSANHRTR